ncbi:hypothetical protein [Streptomyces synnematoformans]|uniref:Uncharacterized protein n=1 Tax=Streptomyces synnematoformans TaxID=415721 RepID=A0ABN2XG69_9ACTN
MSRVHVAASAALAAALLGALLAHQLGGNLDSTGFCALVAYAAATAVAARNWKLNPLRIVRATSKGVFVVAVLAVLVLLATGRSVLHVAGVA